LLEASRAAAWEVLQDPVRWPEWWRGVQRVSELDRANAAGATVVERFARSHGSGVHAVDGSGLTRSNRASPLQVVRLLRSMRRSHVADPYIQGLALTGREGTVDDRTLGTAAEARCRAKTGTLTGVSALSGYCFNRSGRVMIFSILMNSVSNLYLAHNEQDKIAALVARY